jgi:hypothetical protein
MKTSDLDIGGIVGEEQNWAVVLVVWVQDLGAREAVPPCLTVAVDETFAVDLDISVKLLGTSFWCE